MIAFTPFKPSLLLAACALPMCALASTCITAGRMDNAVWAPQFQAVRLLDGAGRIVPMKHQSEWTQVRSGEPTEAPLLSFCDGNQAVAVAEGVQPKGPVPAAKPGRFNVAGLGFPKFQTGCLARVLCANRMA